MSFRRGRQKKSITTTADPYVLGYTEDVKVLLVQAFTALDMELVYPIGLAYLAAHLDDHEVEIFDLNLHRDSKGYFVKMYKSNKPHFLGLKESPKQA